MDSLQPILQPLIRVGRGLSRAQRIGLGTIAVALVALVFIVSTIGRGADSAAAFSGLSNDDMAAVVGKLGGCYLGARLTGQPPREAGCIAALMNGRGLMALIAINVGRDLGLLPPALFTMLVIMGLVTTAMCGPLLRWWLPRSKKAKPLMR